MKCSSFTLVKMLDIDQEEDAITIERMRDRIRRKHSRGMVFYHPRQQAVFLEREPMIALLEQTGEASRQRAQASFFGRSVSETRIMDVVIVADQTWGQ